jgi:hypothetical protein
MVKITKPTDNPKEVFETCISNFRDEVFKSKLESISTNIDSEASFYDTKASSNNLSSIPQQSNINGIVSVDDMKKVYEQKFVKKGQPGRKYYEKLRLSAKNNICPLCNQRTVTTLDHVLPKTLYPIFSVTPFNLIPACADCNKIKDTYRPSIPQEEILHPYYDDISPKQYLYAEFNEETPISINFYIKSSNPQTILEKRLQKHFELFELNKLYTANAAEELSNIQYRLNKLFGTFGENGVKEYLQEEFKSRYENNKNSWQTAMYEILSKNDWFCNGGFKIE